MVIVGVATGALSLVFCALLPAISPKLSFVDSDPVDIIYFVIITVFTAWNTFTSTVFIAYRRTSYVLWVNVAVGALKVGMAFVVRSGGGIAIFNITGIAQIVNVVLSLALMARVFGYRVRAAIEPKILLPSRRFASSTYIGNVLSLLPPTIVPLIVARDLGVTQAAYFYIAYTIASLLFTIPSSIMQSLYAEGSHDPTSLRGNVKRAIVMSGVVLLPAVVLLVTLCPVVLEAFGRDYRGGSSGLLRVFSLSSFLVGLNLALIIVFRVTLQLRAIVFTNLCYAVSLIGTVFICVAGFGLLGVGLAWGFGNVVAIGVGGLFVRRSGLTVPS
jgi:O-antigen/teichoic acid export membrane protein